MNRIEKLVTPREAITLFSKADCLTITLAAEIAQAYADAETRQGHPVDAFALFGCLWHAGRIQGMREERRRRMRPVGRMAREDGTSVPMYDAGGFINTADGWNLYGAYLEAQRACQRALEAYETGRQAFDAGKGAMA